MNEFKFYGEENTENDDAVQLREQQAEKEAEKERKYKKHSVLDNTALLIGAFMAVELCKKYDKFKVFYISYVFALLLGIVRFIAGYENMMVYVILNALGGIPLGIAVILQYQFTPDCYEYGQYKTGLKMRGVTFAAQTFFTKLNGAIATAVSVFALTLIGFREGEGVVQAAGFADKLWTFSCLGSIIGGICTLLILRLYKLNDHDVQLMAKCNNGEISREEAEAQMINQY